MRLIYTEIELTNILNPLAIPFKTRAFVDTGALHLCIQQHIAIQLNLKELEQREVKIADGGKRLAPYAGAVKITFKNRNCFTGAMVLGQEVLLGAIPMDDMDLVIQPALLSVIPNPESPNIPMSVAM